jgi:hypothetical protein
MGKASTEHTGQLVSPYHPYAQFINLERRAVNLPV